MRKIISCFVSISCFFSFCFTAYATEREYGQTTSIPDIIAEAEQISEIAEKHNDYHKGKIKITRRAKMNFRPSRYFTINLPSEHTVRMVCRSR